MRVQQSSDWNKVSTELKAALAAAPTKARKDLTRILQNIEQLVHNLSREEVVLRRHHKTTSQDHQKICEQIEAAIEEYEKWLMFAHLLNG